MILEKILKILKDYSVLDAQPGDTVVLDLSGHCSAQNVNNVWILRFNNHQEYEELVRLIEEYHERSYEDDACEYCGMPVQLQWQRFKVKTVEKSDIEQCKEEGIDIEELYKQLYTI